MSFRGLKFRKIASTEQEVNGFHIFFHSGKRSICLPAQCLFVGGSLRVLEVRSTTFFMSAGPKFRTPGYQTGGFLITMKGLLRTKGE